MDENKVPFLASQPTSKENKLTGFYINLGAIKLRLVFAAPLPVPADFAYELILDVKDASSINQN